jgi:hypothetical protein
MWWADLTVVASPRTGMAYSGADRGRARDKDNPLGGSSTLNRLELATPASAKVDRYKRIAADLLNRHRPLVGSEVSRSKNRATLLATPVTSDYSSDPPVDKVWRDAQAPNRRPRRRRNHHRGPDSA